MVFFVDDISVWATSPDVPTAITTVQAGLNVIYEWSLRYRMPLSLGKSEAIIFSLNRDDLIPGKFQLLLGNDPLVFKAHVRSLGVHLDNQLRFTHHVEALMAACVPRLQQMASIASSTWGSSACDLRSLYVAYIRSKLLYCSQVWFHFLSDALKKKLEVLERNVLRVITGCLRCTRVEDLHKEANVIPLELDAHRMVAFSAEKYRRFEPTDPLYQAFMTHVPLHNRLRNHLRSSLHLVSDEVLRNARITPARWDVRGRVRSRHADVTREPLPIYLCVDPWRASLQYLHRKVVFNLDIQQGYDRTLSESEVQRRVQATYQSLRAQWCQNSDFAYEVWSDGAAQVHAPFRGAAAAIVWQKGARAKRDATKACGPNCPPLRSECSAMELGVAQMWSFIVSGIRFDRNGVSSPGNGAILVCSDSQVLLRSLRRGPLSQDGYLEGSIWRNILSIVESYPALRAFVFQWIPGKVNYDKMQRAHQLATGALAAFTAQDHSTAPISYKCTRLAITRQVRESWAAAAAGPHRARIFGSGPTQLRQSGEISRRDASLLAQIRVGKHRELGSLFFDLRGLFHTDSRLCRWCTNVA